MTYLYQELDSFVNVLRNTYSIAIFLNTQTRSLLQRSRTPAPRFWLWASQQIDFIRMEFVNDIHWYLTSHFWLNPVSFMNLNTRIAPVIKASIFFQNILPIRSMRVKWVDIHIFKYKRNRDYLNISPCSLFASIH